jgi:hypothetical protein
MTAEEDFAEAVARHRLLRWKVLPLVLRGGFPRGAPAPPEVRPRRTAADAGEAAGALSENAERFLASLAQARVARRVRLTHSTSESSIRPRSSSC